MNTTTDDAALRREEALRDERRRVKEIKGFYFAAIVIPSSWAASFGRIGR